MTNTFLILIIAKGLQIKSAFKNQIKKYFRIYLFTLKT